MFGELAIAFLVVGVILIAAERALAAIELIG